MRAVRLFELGSTLCLCASCVMVALASRDVGRQAARADFRAQVAQGCVTRLAGWTQGRLGEADARLDALEARVAALENPPQFFWPTNGWTVETNWLFGAACTGVLLDVVSVWTNDGR